MKTRSLFISYRSSDAAKVDKIAKDLSLLGFDDGTPRYTTWQDKHNIPPASPSWWDAIVDAIIDCDIFVFNLSRASLQSEVCRAELEYAHRRNRPIIPVVLDDEFILNPGSGRYDLPKETWALVPDWLAETQFLFYVETQFYGKFQEAVAVFERNWPRDIPAPRPLNPDIKSMDGSNHARYSAACDYAGRLAFADAEKLFDALVRRNDEDYADLAAKWLNLIRRYAELIEIVERRSPAIVFNRKWTAYRGLFPNDLVAGTGIFDPKGIALYEPPSSIVPSLSVSELGMPHKPSQHKSLQERLLSFGILVNDDLRKEGILSQLEAKFAIDDVIVDAEFAGFRGIVSSQLSVVPASREYPQLPDYVYESRETIARPGLNKWKAYLEGWSAPIIDRGNIVSMQIGSLDSRVPDGRYDYWTTLAVLRSIPRLQQDLLAGTLRLRDLARRLDLVLVVVTADDQLVLARRSEQVDNAKGNWMASIGESLDPSLDLDNHRVPNPLEAARRCLGEHDELNLASSDISNAHMQILGIATEWKYLYANLIVLVKLNVEFGRVKERVSEGEHTGIEGLAFTPEACLPLVRHGRYEASTSGRAAPLVPASRVALLMGLMSRFGYDEVVERIR